jgi:hypothetical protein
MSKSELKRTCDETVTSPNKKQSTNVVDLESINNSKDKLIMLFEWGSPVFKKLMYYSVVYEHFILSLYKAIQNKQSKPPDYEKKFDYYFKFKLNYDKCKSDLNFAETQKPYTENVLNKIYKNYNIKLQNLDVSINPDVSICINMKYIPETSKSTIVYYINNNNNNPINILLNVHNNIIMFTLFKYDPNVFNKIITMIINYINIPDIDKINFMDINIPYNNINIHELIDIIHNLLKKLKNLTNDNDKTIEIINLLFLKIPTDTSFNFLEKYNIYKKSIQMFYKLCIFNSECLTSIQSKKFDDIFNDDIKDYNIVNIIKHINNIDVLYKLNLSFCNYIYMQNIYTKNFNIDVIIKQFKNEYIKYMTSISSLWFINNSDITYKNNKITINVILINYLKKVANIYNDIFNQSRNEATLLLPNINTITIPWNCYSINDLIQILHNKNYIISKPNFDINDNTKNIRSLKESYGNNVLKAIKSNNLNFIEKIQYYENYTQKDIEKNVKITYYNHVDNDLLSYRNNSILPDSAMFQCETKYKLFVFNSITYNKNITLKFSELIIDMISRVILDWCWSANDTYYNVREYERYTNVNYTFEYYKNIKKHKSRMFWCKHGINRITNMPDNIFNIIETYTDTKDEYNNTTVSKSTLNIYDYLRISKRNLLIYNDSIRLIHSELIYKTRGKNLFKKDSKNPFILIANKHHKNSLLYRNNMRYDQYSTRYIDSYTNIYMNSLEEIKSNLYNVIYNDSNFLVQKKYKRMLLMLLSQSMNSLFDNYLN